jgi:hypothetical protein
LLLGQLESSSCHTPIVWLLIDLSIRKHTILIIPLPPAYSINILIYIGVRKEAQTLSLSL